MLLCPFACAVRQTLKRRKKPPTRTGTGTRTTQKIGTDPSQPPAPTRSVMGHVSGRFAAPDISDLKTSCGARLETGP